MKEPTQAEIKENKKKMVLEYLEIVPVYKWAAKYVLKSEDTLKAWRDEDTEFADACEARISEFVRRTIKRTKPEFQLERLLKDDFSQRSEVGGPGGGPIHVVITDYGVDPSLEDITKER